MNEQDKKQNQDAAPCGCGCNCKTSGPGSRGRMIAGIVILLITGALVVRAVVKDHDISTIPAPTGFAVLAVPEQSPSPEDVAKPTVTNTMMEITAFSELNTVAGDTVGVFVFLPGRDETTTHAPITQMQNAARTIEPQLRGGKIGFFTLRAGSPDYEQIVLQTAAPGVIAMVKGGGMSATSGDITETKLVQALVAASSSGGCGTGGCGPSSAGCAPVPANGK